MHFEQELSILQQLKGKKGGCFTELVNSGTSNPELTRPLISQTVKFLVMKKLGVSVYDVYSTEKENMRDIDVLKLGLQMTKAVEKFHLNGYIHQDIKVNNFLFGGNDVCHTKDNAVRDQASLEHRERVEMEERKQSHDSSIYTFS